MEASTRSGAEAARAARHEDWGSLTWLASDPISQCNLTLGRVIIKKGKSNPRHAHNNCEEVLYLLSGRLEHTMGDHKAILEAGDTIAVPAGMMHNGINIGDCDADMIVAYSSGNRDFVLEQPKR